MVIGSCIAALKFHASGIFGTGLNSSTILPLHSASELTHLHFLEAFIYFLFSRNSLSVCDYVCGCVCCIRCCYYW